VRDVRVEVIEVRQVRFAHHDLKVIALTPAARPWLNVCTVNRDHAGVLFVDGRYVVTLAPGQYAFSKGAADARVVEIDMRETTADVSGQEIMTADKVSLRMNARVTYRVTDARKAVSTELARPERRIRTGSLDTASLAKLRREEGVRARCQRSRARGFSIAVSCRHAYRPGQLALGATLHEERHSLIVVEANRSCYRVYLAWPLSFLTVWAAERGSYQPHRPTLVAGQILTD